MQVVFFHDRQLTTHGGSSHTMIPFVDSAVTIGSFDGVHLGHRAIIADMLETARQRSFRSVVVTFEPHPRLVVESGNHHPVELLTTLDEKIVRLADLGVDLLVVVRFTAEFAVWSSEDFAKYFLVGLLSAKSVTVGYDHGFGRNRSGSGKRLAELGLIHGFTVRVVEELRINHGQVSSTRIRGLLKEGLIAEANVLLGAPYLLNGVVVEGRGLGRTLGFPTVNLRVSDSHKLLPRNGVYVATTSLGGCCYRAMLNIGTRPTVSEQRDRVVEAHILGCAALLYGRTLGFSLLVFVREERRFGSAEALRRQLEKDKKTVESFFK